jgi:hypothetical protein
VTEDEMREIVMSFPGVVEATSHGRPAFLVNNKFFTRFRSQDASLVLMGVFFDEREMLMEAEPTTFHLTAHYKDYPAAPSWRGSRACTLARCAIFSNAAG